jgi:hypothetical protein
MTQDEIIEMARQSNLLGIYADEAIDSVTRFAKLVAEAAASKEREACAKYVEGLMVGNQPLTVVMGAIGDGIRARSGATSRGEAQ